MKCLSDVEFTQAVARRWIARRTAMGIKPKGVTHAKLQLEFFIGAHTAAEEIGQPHNHMALVLLSVGKDASCLLPKSEQAKA